MLHVRWMGFDYGETLMDPSDLRNHMLWGDTYKALGKPELVADKVRAYRILREAYGEYHVMKEAHRHEVFAYVLDKDEEAQRAFMEAEPRLLGESDHVTEGLSYLRHEGIVLDVVSELIRTVGPIEENVILRFLRSHKLSAFFRHLITPLGKIDVATGKVVDTRYRGYTKGEGTIFDVLVEDLAEQGIRPEEAMMVGDRPGFDIEPARARGLRTVQYCGYTELPGGKADACIKSFLEFRDIVAGAA